MSSCFSSSDIAVVEMTDAFRQPSLFYHLGVRESFSMANSIILYCDTNSDSLQSLQVSRDERETGQSFYKILAFNEGGDFYLCIIRIHCTLHKITVAVMDIWLVIIFQIVCNFP